jgi:2-dehydro-3-deoxyphosphogluconate aldolase/(4S)-4-hydroxy-2-oxoglutarate aldolase
MADDTLIARLRTARVVPVVRTHSMANARTVVGWLRDVGITVFEITMTIPDAPALIAELSADPTLLVGAGTVPDAATAAACIAAGAKFIVAPWVDPALSAPCKATGAALLLGAITPTEVRAALAAGAGGPGHIKALCSVFPGVMFCPTGGIGPADVPKYLVAGASFVGMGGALVDEARVAAGDQDAIVAAARQILA